MRIRLSDGSFFVVHAEVFARENLATGSPIDSDRMLSLKERSERVFARECALGLISNAPQTRRGLGAKLLARGFGPKTVRRTLARMIELKYLDDRLFAENWISSRLSTRNEGWKALYLGLVRRGVPRQIAEEAVSSCFTDEAEMEKARGLVVGFSPTAVVRRLSNRGFRARTIARILKESRGRDRKAREE